MSIEDIANKAAADMDEAHAAYRSTLQGLVVKHHPHQIGDVVTANGWSHKGKKIQITHRSIAMEYKGWRWTAIGWVIKANGEIGKQDAEWSEKVSQ